MESGKISIIIPIYNVEKYVERCLKSVLNQTYKNLEVILVDDGSSDNSLKIAEIYQKKDTRVKLIRKKNGGLSDARNVGMKKATGEYLMFIDSDDFISQEMCKKLLELLMKDNSEIATCEIFDFYFEKDIEKFLNARKNEYKNLKFDKIQTLNKYFNPTKNLEIYHGLCMKIYQKKLFNGLEFSVGRLHEDLYITYKLLSKVKNLSYTSEPLYYYFQRPESITKNVKIKNIIDELDAIKEYKNYFKNIEEIKKNLNTFLLNYYGTTILKLNNLKIPANEKRKLERAIKNEIKKIEFLSIFFNKDTTLKQKIKVTLIKMNLELFKKIMKNFVLKS